MKTEFKLIEPNNNQRNISKAWVLGHANRSRNEMAHKLFNILQLIIPMDLKTDKQDLITVIKNNIKKNYNSH